MRLVAAAAALFGLVSGAASLATLLVAIGGAEGSARAVLAAFASLIVLDAAISSVLIVTSALALLPVGRDWPAARAAGVLLGGRALGYLPAAAITAPVTALGAILPAAAAALLWWAGRKSPAASTRAWRATPAAAGRALLLGTAAVALVWSAVGLAGIPIAQGLTTLSAFTAVQAGLSLAALHAAWAVLLARSPSLVLLVAGAIDVAIAAPTVPNRLVSEVGFVLAVGVLLVGLGALTRRSRGARTAA